MDDKWKQLPEKFLQRVNQIVPNEKTKTILNAFCVKRPVSLRVNTLKTTADELEKDFKQLGISLERVPWYSDAFILKDDPKIALRDIMASPIYMDGSFYIQSLSSMIPPFVMDPQPDENILDLAAAPGSKTTQMAMMMKNRGEIIANDISVGRIYKLKANLASHGVTNTKIMKMPGQFLWRRYPEYFDKTLVDAPCSLEGRFNCYDPKSYKDWTPKKVEILSQRERFLLRSAISATRPGGIIVYSTCTLSPEENEEVIDWILKKEGDAIDLEPVEIKNLQTDEPILKWKNKTYDPRVKYCLRIFPSEAMEGFFVAKIRKLRPTLTPKF